ncbi:MAG: tyrosine-type recombinase/integrase [Chloroflexota bacterium]|nr:tyrosine-type recombinase/integrase [Chloroflexota bacterium]
MLARKFIRVWADALRRVADVLRGERVASSTSAPDDSRVGRAKSLRGAAPSLRRSERLGLVWDDIDLSRRLLYVRRAKGGRQRVVPIHRALAPLVAA